MANEPMTVQDVAGLLGARLEGDGRGTIADVASLAEAEADQITFAADARRAARLVDSRAGAAIVMEIPRNRPPDMALLVVDDVDAAVARLLDHLGGERIRPAAGVHPAAVIDPEARIASGASIGPGAVVGAGASIGPGSAVGANVSVGPGTRVGADCVLAEGVVVAAGCVLGDRVQIGPNAVIGADGFGYYARDGVHHKFRHIGNVVIEDDVEIGACSCVDRAKFGSTRIGAGTKIDNLVQVAHNVQVGRGCLLCGQAGIAGSAKLGDYVVAGGHAGIRDGITVGAGVQCAAFAAVAADVPDGQVVVGIPAAPARDLYRFFQARTKLPELLKRVKTLEARLASLGASEDH